MAHGSRQGIRHTRRACSSGAADGCEWINSAKSCGDLGVHAVQSPAHLHEPGRYGTSPSFTIESIGFRQACTPASIAVITGVNTLVSKHGEQARANAV